MHRLCGGVDGSNGFGGAACGGGKQFELGPFNFPLTSFNFNVGIGFGAVVRQDLGEFGAGLLGGGEVHVCKLTHPMCRVNMPFGLYP